MTTATPPTREEVASRWLAVARGDVPREEVSAWAEPLMRADYESAPDVMAMQALQYLHGFDITYRSPDHRLVGHGPPGPYVRTLEQISEEYAAWLERCNAYDADPEGWFTERRSQGEAAVRRELEQRQVDDRTPGTTV